MCNGNRAFRFRRLLSSRCEFSNGRNGIINNRFEYEWFHILRSREMWSVRFMFRVRLYFNPRFLFRYWQCKGASLKAFLASFAFSPILCISSVETEIEIALVHRWIHSHSNHSERRRDLTFLSLTFSEFCIKRRNEENKAKRRKKGMSKAGLQIVSLRAFLFHFFSSFLHERRAKLLQKKYTVLSSPTIVCTAELLWY